MVRRPGPLRALPRALVTLMVAALVALGLTPVLVTATPAGAQVCAPVRPTATAQDAAVAAADWLATQIQPDGSFEVAGFRGFETPDAVLAIAEAAQTGPTWSTDEALAAVQALAGCTASPLEWLDTWSRSGISGGDAAKLIVLVAGPLGLSSTAFDPAEDGTPVDLTALVGDAGAPDGWYGTFGETIYAALALRLVAGTVPEVTVGVIRAGQHADGGWDYTGDPSTETPEDLNTSASALMGLIAGGAAQDDPAVVAGLGYLAGRQETDGGWREDGDAVTNPNATALCALAIRVAGYDPDADAWKPATPAGAASTTAVTGTPTDALLATQDPDGHLVGPYDEFGLNTFGTAQGVQGMLRLWLVGALPVATPSTTTTTTAPTTTTTAAAAAGTLARSGASGAGTSALLGAASLLIGFVLLAVRRRLA